uniref:MHC class I-like antigen recognition-like domain-containing protein n=1 Tax=Podarcis muralis TaxID=64176 RepID=A0A670IRP4_PODMU
AAGLYLSTLPPPASLPLPETPHALCLLQTVVFHNASDTDIEGTTFLGDVAVVTLDTNTWKFKFLQPWGRSGLTPQEWDGLLKIIKGYFLGFVQTINKMVVFRHFSAPVAMTHSGQRHCPKRLHSQASLCEY